MFCSNCGQQVADGLSFCPNCGTKLAAQINVQPVIPQTEPQAPIQQTPTQQAPVQQQAPIQQQPVMQHAAAAAAAIVKKPLDKKQIKKIGIIAGAAVVAIAAVIGVVSLVTSGGSSDNSLFHDGLVPFRSGKNYGFLNKDGEIAISPMYERAEEFSEGLACVSTEVKGESHYGYINKKGETVIDLQYDKATNFKDGIAEVFVGDHAGFIDKKGKYVINAQYDSDEIAYIGYNMFLIEDPSEDFWSLCDKKGNKITETRFDFPKNVYTISPLINTEWGSKKNKIEWDTIPLKTITGNYIYINNKGKTVLETQYDYAGYFCDGIAVVGIEDDYDMKYGYINKKGECIISPQFEDANPFIDGLASVGIDSKHDTKYGYINKKGEYVVSPQYDSASAFNNGVAIVSVYSEKKNKDRYGIINKKGKVLCEPQYDFISFGEDKKHILFEMNNKYGYLNYKGEVDIPNEYEYASAFYSDGYAAVKVTDDKWTIIDSKGEKVWNNMFDQIG